MKRILALVLGLAMLSALASGCAPTGESGGGQSSPAVNTGSNTSYTIATNNFGAGVYPLDTNAAYEQNAADALGVTLNVTNNEFTADKSITQLQNQLASAPDGVAFLGISETLFPVAAQYCKNAETPYVCSLRVRPRMRMWRPLSRTSTMWERWSTVPRAKGPALRSWRWPTAVRLR